MVRRRHSLTAREHILDYVSWLKAVVLGIVEGATEFIPVSSTGHLILAGNWLAFEGDAAVTFDIVIQLGAILAVVWIYRAKLSHALFGWKTDPSSRRLILNLGVAFLPAAVLGFLLHDFIEERLFSPSVVAVSMVAGGVAILAIERWHRKAGVMTTDDIGPKLAFWIGLAQCLSLVPGVSRSGATIMGALALGVGRLAATEFSFFLAVPVMFAATGYTLLKNSSVIHADQITIIAIGFVVSFLAAMVVVKKLIGFVAGHTFAPFAWYRIIFGAVLIAYYFR
jgi:undecaprenyl-diphosphatase